MRIEQFYDPTTSALTYLVFDPVSRDAVVIDPVLDYDPLASRISIAPLRPVADFVRTHQLRLHMSLETHPHADHVSGAQWLREQFGARVAIGAAICEVQYELRERFGRPELATDGSQFDRLLDDGELVEAGTIDLYTIATPGHTRACVTYCHDDALFTGDALFAHDTGTGRCDFPGGSASDLFDSIRRLYEFPDATRVFPAHDYRPGGRPLLPSTIGQSKYENPQLSLRTTRTEFVALRNARDRTLDPPRLLYPSVPINLDGGRLPAMLAVT